VGHFNIVHSGKVRPYQPLGLKTNGLAYFVLAIVTEEKVCEIVVGSATTNSDETDVS
jgi:hypothetical protein